MARRRTVHILVALAGLAAAGGVAAAGPRALRKHTFKVRLGPLPANQKVAWSHGPYEAGDCSICHASADPRKPGPVSKPGNELCFGCHEEFQEIMARRYKHPPAQESCLHCHNPHNSAEKKLLHVELGAGCKDCHPAIREVAAKARVKHGALETGARCASCHNPHGANVEKLLIQLPFDLCVNCHGADGMKDHAGVSLTNFKKLLEENRFWHAPVAAKDCSACHRTHGGDNFRLLVADYPAKFYAPYDLKNYALCYGCHNEKVVGEPVTRTLTNFRDGSRNLHFVHVNKAERGRTCRACHDVHASKQPLHIRQGVPYGVKGWILRINYTKTPTGGTCAKTCHETKTYSRAGAGASRK
ncbi:MAG TPA: cytochrome c3 family protein [Anaeromyxobacteraceae bacterium]|jgi:predicted CXXCH cytochrome family protein